MPLGLSQVLELHEAYVAREEANQLHTMWCHWNARCHVSYVPAERRPSTHRTRRHGLGEGARRALGLRSDGVSREVRLERLQRLRVVHVLLSSRWSSEGGSTFNQRSSMEDTEEDEEGIPGFGIIGAVVSIGLIARFRRR